MYDWLIVGAGLTGATLAERIANELGLKVLVVDRRDHVGGNAYDEYDEHGVLVHRYGPHVFHTNAPRVKAYLSRFTDWTPSRHEVLGLVDGQLVPIPFNLESVRGLFPATQADRLERKLLARFEYGRRVPIGKLRETGDRDLVFLADFVRERVFEGYNRKQWGITANELIGNPADRVPVKISRSNRYYDDVFEGMPAHGYTSMFRRMLRHPNIHVLLNTDYRAIMDVIPFSRMIYTGPIDEFFDRMHGSLLYRSLKFEFQHVESGDGLPAAQVNYPERHAHFRATDFGQLVRQNLSATTVLRETPVPYVPQKNEPFYFVPTEDLREIHRKYKEEASHLKNTVLFTGWLTAFQYYNMDQAVASALTVFKRMRAAAAGTSADSTYVRVNENQNLAAASAA